MKTKEIGLTREHLPIISYEFKPAQASSSEILILGGVHGDEPEGIIAALILLHHWTSHFPFQFNATLIPQFNIEGIINKNRHNSAGVDLNRNMPTKDWSAEIKNPRYYPGTAAGSEPETQALLKYINNKKPQLIISLHSWNPVLNVNGDCLYVAEAIANVNNYKIDNDIGYPTPGCLGTYAGIERSSPTLTFEIERGLSASQIRQTQILAIYEGLKAFEIKQKEDL